MNLKSATELIETLKERFEEAGISVSYWRTYEDSDFKMILTFDYNELKLDYMAGDKLCIMKAAVNYRADIEAPCLFDATTCAYSIRSIMEIYMFHFKSEDDVENFIQWVIEEVKPKLTA